MGLGFGVLGVGFWARVFGLGFWDWDFEGFFQSNSVHGCSCSPEPAVGCFMSGEVARQLRGRYCFLHVMLGATGSI